MPPQNTTSYALRYGLVANRYSGAAPGWSTGRIIHKRSPTRVCARGPPRRGRDRPADLTDEMIAQKIIELAKAGERNVEVLCEAALNVPARAISAPNPPPLPASPPSKLDSSF